MEIKRVENNRIKIIGDNGGFIDSQSVEANLLFAILEKLEEIHCEIIETQIVIKQWLTSSAPKRNQNHENPLQFANIANTIKNAESINNI